MPDGNNSQPTMTMSKQFYLNEDLYEKEKEKIFYREWICIGHISQLPEVGSYFTADVAGQSVVAIRQKDDSIRVFYNVCQHRAHPLLKEGHGKRRVIACPYHAWTYDLDGELKRARGTDGVPGFKDQCIRLRQIRSDIAMGLVFLNMDDNAAPLMETIGKIISEVEEIAPNLAKMRMVAEHILHHESNWKVTLENFTECYHCPVAHKYLLENVYTSEDYKVTFDGPIFRHYSKGLGDPAIHGDDFRIWFIWPNFSIHRYPVHKCISLRHWRPHGHSKNDYVFRWYVDPDLSEDAVQEVIRYAQIHNDTTGEEDAVIAEQVQTGLKNRGYTSGPLVVKPEIGNENENAVAHFQQLYLMKMGAQSDAQ